MSATPRVASHAHLRLVVPGSSRREFEAQALVHLDPLYRTALRLTHNRPEAEDLVQDAYLRAFTFFERFEPGTNCRAWLFTILRNAFLNRIRGRRREGLDDDSELASATASVTAPSSDNPEVEFFRKVLPADVEGALRALPLVFREAVILVEVMSRLSRARRLLRYRLHHLVGPESRQAGGGHRA